MTPTFISTTFYPKGTRLDERTEPLETPVLEPEPAGREITSAVAMYVPTLDKCVEDGDLPEAGGLLTEDVFTIDSLTEIGATCGDMDHHWLVDFMAECGNEDVKNAAGQIYELVKPGIENILEDRKKPSYLREGIWPIPASLIGLWTPQGGTDYWTGHYEIDCIEFCGEGQVEPVKTS